VDKESLSLGPGEEGHRAIPTIEDERREKGRLPDTLANHFIIGERAVKYAVILLLSTERKRGKRTAIKRREENSTQAVGR